MKKEEIEESREGSEKMGEHSASIVDVKEKAVLLGNEILQRVKDLKELPIVLRTALSWGGGAFVLIFLSKYFALVPMWQGIGIGVVAGAYVGWSSKKRSENEK